MVHSGASSACCFVLPITVLYSMPRCSSIIVILRRIGTSGISTGQTAPAGIACVGSGSVGFSVGCCDGAGVGWGVGSGVGMRDGMPDGEEEGMVVGWLISQSSPTQPGSQEHIPSR